MTENDITAQASLSKGEPAPAHDEHLLIESAPTDGEQLSEETRIRRLNLYRAALSGDWDIAKRIYDEYEDDVSVKISKRGYTALHLAAALQHTHFVKQLVGRMRAEDIAQQSLTGHTALHYAAATDYIELAKVMMAKNKVLAMIRNAGKWLPLHVAAISGCKHMVKFLYQETKDKLGDEDRINLLVSLLESNLYGVALELLRDYPDLSTARDVHQQTALHVLATKPLTSSNFANQNQRGILRRCFNLVGSNNLAVSGAKYGDNEKLQAEALELVEELWKKVVLLSESKILELTARPWPFIVFATIEGNTEFLSILIREYPDLLWDLDANGRGIIHFAIQNRQENIFKLVYEMGTLKGTLGNFRTDTNENVLHLAGYLPPPNRLNVVSGAALQLQRELLWFKEVSKVVFPSYAEILNKDGLTPRALFTKEHEDLRGKGEKWMKDTATSCMLVATLIATVVFAAAFTVPGGNKGDTGFPTFLQKISFKIFAISDAISLVFSSASIVNFLSILTSRYAEEDFLELLPRKLLIGLATLFVSIVAMMVVFSATLFIVFDDGIKWIAVLVALIGSTPVLMFSWQQYPLFYDVLRSTYVSSSLFQPDKISLFHRKRNKQPKAHSTITSNV